MANPKVISADSPEARWVPAQSLALRISLGYALAGTLWIFGTGWLLHRFVHSGPTEALLETVKGWFFVFVTACLLGLALNHYFRVIRKSAQLLLASDQRWQFAMEGAGHGVWDWNVQTGEVFYSPGWTQMFQFEPGEFAPNVSSWRDRIHPDDLAASLEALDRHLSGQTPEYVNEHRIRCKDGSYKWIADRGKVVVRTPDGKPLRVVGTHTDITEQKRVEQALRVSEERLRLASQAALIGTWDRDVKANRLHWSAEQERLMGFAPGTFPGTDEAFLALVHPDSREIHAEAQKRARHGDGQFQAELHFRCRDGGDRWGLVRGRTYFDSEGKPDRIIGVDIDITDRKRLEAQLRQAQKLEGIGQLAGGVAHDFNNILAVIMMHLELLQATPDINERTRVTLKELDSEARRAAGLTRQLLMFSRRSVLNVKPLDINLVIANLMKMLTRLIGEDIQLRFEQSEPLPWVDADVGMIEQILVNLVVNARDAMPKGGRITVRTSATQFDEAAALERRERRRGSFVRLDVADTGCGMDTATMKRLFEPFFTTKEPGRGTGLGLATVHGIATQHKGWVEVESAVGRGTTFHIFFPAGTNPADSAESHPSLPPMSGGKETILLVEDEEKVRHVVAQAFAQRIPGLESSQWPGGGDSMANTRGSSRSAVDRHGHAGRHDRPRTRRTITGFKAWPKGYHL